MDRIKIIIADDHKLVRDGLRNLIESQQPGMEVIAEAGDGLTAVQLAQKMSPQVVLMDISMPRMNGIDATRQITSERPDIKVIALSMHADRLIVIKMLTAGAAGYLLKDCTFEELVHAIQAVASNRSYLSGQLADTTIKECTHLFPEKNFSL